MTSVCGVLNTHAFFASTGSMMRTDEAREMVGVSPSATTSVMASELGVVVEPMIASTAFSAMSFLAFCTASVVSLASSRTMYSTLFPAMVLGHMATVFFSGMPSEAAGPVVDTVTPILICACAAPVSDNIAAAATPQIVILFIEPPRCFRPSGGRMIAERAEEPSRSATPLDA